MRGSANRSIFFWIIVGGFIAATVDIGAAALINWLSPAIILRYIASGLVGSRALHLGTSGVVLGLLLQWLMGIIIAATFFLAALLVGRARLLSSGRWVAAALAYGAVIFHYNVMPLSAIHRVPHFTLIRGIENLLAMFLFAIIVALSARPALLPGSQEATGLSSPPRRV